MAQKIVSPVLLIGLGGTGYKTLLKVKKSVLKNYGELPSMVKLLTFDTDRKEMMSSTEEIEYNKIIDDEKILTKEKISFDKNEVVGISVTNPLALLRTDFIKEWLSEKVVPMIGPSDEGAKQIRQMGRFAIYENYNKQDIRGQISSLIADLKDVKNLKNTRYSTGDDNAKPQVHLVFSPGGGTGAGTFIDIIMIIKNIDPSIKIYGYMVMPDFYTDFPMTDKVVSNAYASLIEIDHLMGQDKSLAPNKLGVVDRNWSNFDSNNPFTSNYTGKDKFSLPPGSLSFFSNLYLFDNVNENGKTMSNVEDMYDRIGRILYLMISGPGSKMQSNYNNNDDYMSPSSNIFNYKRRNYSSMGIAQIILDKNYLKELKTTQFINVILNSYCFDNLNLDNEIFNVFIDSNSWREDKGKDMVIDRLMPQNQLKYAFETVYPSEFGKESNVVLQANVKNLLRDIDLKVKTSCEKVGNELFEDFKIKVSDKISIHLKNKGGVSECKQFLSFMIGSFQGMANEMNEEGIKHTSNKTVLEKNLLDFVAAIVEEENSKNPFGRKGRIQKECENYVGQSEKILTENWHIIRKEAAKLFYDKCLEILKEHQKNINNFADLLIEANTKIETDKYRLLNTIKSERDFERHIHTFYKDLLIFNDEDINIEEAFRGIDFSSLYKLNKISDIISQITNFAKTTVLIKDIDKLTVEGIIEKLDEDTKKNIINHLNGASAVNIDIDPGFTLNTDKPKIQKFGFFCVNDETTVESSSEIYKNIGNDGGYTDLKAYSTGDPDTITMLKISGMFPGAAIKRIEQYKQKFINSSGFHYSDMYFEKYAMDLIDGPSDDDGEAQKWFTVGSALGKIYLKSGSLILEYENGQPIQLNENNKNKTNRIKCFEVFSKNKEYSKYIEEIFKIEIRNEDQLKQKLIDFYYKIESIEILGKQFASLNNQSPEEWENVFKERKLLVDFGMTLGIDPKNFVTPKQ